MADTEQFSLRFDGSTLNDGTIDARELAPSLLALADLFDVVVREIDSEAKVNLRVHSDFRRGSFEVELTIFVIGLYSQFIDIFSSKEVQAVTALLGMVGISGTGLFQLVKKAKGRVPRKTVTIERTDRVRIEFEDGDDIEVHRVAAELLDNHEARRALAGVTAPLNREGIETLDLAHGGRDTFHLDQGDVFAFRPPDDSEDDFVFDSDRIVRIVSPSFKDGNKWRVHDGSGTIYASISDQDFLRRVEQRQELFGNNEFLHVTMRTRQWYEAGSLKTAHEIVEVKRHIPSQHQEPFDLDNPDQ